MSWKVLITARAAEEVGQPAYQLLRDAGCEVGQGWLFGRAMPEDELHQWLAEHSQAAA